MARGKLLPPQQAVFCGHILNISICISPKHVLKLHSSIKVNPHGVNPASRERGGPGLGGGAGQRAHCWRPRQYPSPPCHRLPAMTFTEVNATLKSLRRWLLSSDSIALYHNVFSSQHNPPQPPNPNHFAVSCLRLTSIKESIRDVNNSQLDNLGCELSQSREGFSLRQGKHKIPIIHTKWRMEMNWSLHLN